MRSFTTHFIGILLCGTIPVDAFIVGAYYSVNPDGFNSSNIDFSQLTHIFHTPVVANSDGSLNIGNDDPNFLEPSLIEIAHKYGTKVLVTVGAYDIEVFSNETCLQIFVENVVDFVRVNNYDGVDVDYEVPNSSNEASAFANFFVSLRKLLPRPYLISCAVPAIPQGSWGGWGYFDFSIMTPQLDFYNVMGYDIYSESDQYAGHNAPLYQSPSDPQQNGSLDYSIKVLTELGIPAFKISMGIPFYCNQYSFKGADLWQSCGLGKRACSRVMMSYGYNGLQRDISNNPNKWEEKFDQDARAPYYVNTNGSSFVSCDTAASTVEKVQFAIRNSLAGVFTWEISNDWMGAKLHPLVDAMNAALFRTR